ncbi:MAG: glycosyltransferase family 9 protein [Burkholderiaceae bacterium]
MSSSVDLAIAANADRLAAWRGVRRLLAVRVDNLGDVLMTTPALAAAAQSLPGVEITLLGGPRAGALAPHLPMVREIIPARVPWVPGDVDPSHDHLLIERLADGRFDAAVIFTVCTQSALPAALMCRLAGIPLRLAHVRENPYGLLSDWVPETDLVLDDARHEVRRQLDLVGHVGWRTTDERLRFALRQPDVARIDAWLDGEWMEKGERPLVVVHVGATAPSRRWPAERFGQVADVLAYEQGARIVFTGGADEAELVAAARACMRQPSHSLAGRLTLGQLGALIARADLLVGNNSGPAHLAAALGTPVVDVYALTNPQHTPWRVPSRVLSRDVECRGCLKSRCPQGHHRCIADVAPAEAVDAALSLLAQPRSAPSETHLLETLA